MRGWEVTTLLKEACDDQTDYFRRMFNLSSCIQEAMLKSVHHDVCLVCLFEEELV